MRENTGVTLFRWAEFKELSILFKNSSQGGAKNLKAPGSIAPRLHVPGNFLGSSHLFQTSGW